MRHAWLDLTAGVAGDMLLGALVDAGADLAGAQAAVDAVAPGSVRLAASTVRRAGQRATLVSVEALVESPPHRTWASIRDDLADADLRPWTRQRALAVFERLAEAEARVHGTRPDDVHFHEVGALDSIADVVGVCEALRLLGVEGVSASPICAGAGRVRAAHGSMPVPVPAVAELLAGWRSATLPGGDDSEPGELATPTGVALARALSLRCESLPPLTVGATGIGAGSRDYPTHANVVRVVLGERTPGDDARPRLVEQAANVDDLDPRLWPDVLRACLDAGAVDAWLVPILMKKGRPGHTVHTLVTEDASGRVADVLLRHTTTLGVRELVTHRHVLDRSFATLAIEGEPLTVKVGAREGRVVHAAAEFESLAAVASALGRPQAEIAQRAAAAIVAAGLVPGAAVPHDD